MLGAISGETVWPREWLHGEHTGSEGWQFVTDGREKFVWQSSTGTEWFFDLEKDPGELHNAAVDDEYAERVALWRRRLVGVLAERPEDGLSDGERLVPGKTLPSCRSHLVDTED